MSLMLKMLVLLSMLGSLQACKAADGIPSSSKGGVEMKTYRMGRFAIDVPVEMKQEVQAQTLRLAEVEDFTWPNDEGDADVRERLWKSRLAKIKELHLPENVKHHIIEENNLHLNGRWGRAVLFYGNYIFPDEGTWGVLVDYGSTGLWLRYEGLLKAKKEMKEWVEVIAKAYRPLSSGGVDGLPHGNWFYLRHGAIDLPYKRQEKTYSRFIGHPLNLKLEVEMKETHRVAKVGLAERLATAIATRFAPGVDVDTIRSRSRTAAGIKGEELVMRMSARGEDTQLQFCWEYRGEAESGEHPKIQITLETSDGKLDEKLKVWDAVIDSLRPMYQ